jgi:enoyl-CoA hydratase
MSSLHTMTYEVADPDRVARITLNRPARGNGIARQLVGELERCVERPAAPA